MTEPCATSCGVTPTMVSLLTRDVTGWTVSPRGAGYLFGGDIVEQFNRDNNIDLIA